MICPKCHYDWKINCCRCKCGCYLDHGIKEDTWKEATWTQEHKKFIDSLPFEKQMDWYKYSGNEGEQRKSIQQFKSDTNKYLNSLRDISENDYDSFKSNTFLIKKIIEEAIGNDATIFASYGDIKCTDKDESCKSILVINDPEGHGTGEVIEVADNNFELLIKLINNKK